MHSACLHIRQTICLNVVGTELKVSCIVLNQAVWTLVLGNLG